MVVWVGWISAYVMFGLWLVGWEVLLTIHLFLKREIDCSLVNRSPTARSFLLLSLHLTV
jgi:hypothetical protein